MRFLLERDLDDAANTRAREGRRRDAERAARSPAAGHPEAGPRRRPDHEPGASRARATSLRALTEIADKQVKRALESVDGVGDVTISGDRPREIHIVVDIEKLNAHGLSIDQVRDAIQKENVEIPGGTLEQGKWEVGLRTLGRIDASEQFNDIIIATVNGVPVRVSDIGYAEDTVQKVATSLFMQDGSPGGAARHPARVRREHHQGHRGREGRSSPRSGRRCPPDVTLTMNTDDSRFIYASISSLEEHLLWGSLLASLVVMFFIRNIRAVIISALAIPASIIATFTLMRGDGLHAQQHDAARR